MERNKTENTQNLKPAKITVQTKKKKSQKNIFFQFSKIWFLIFNKRFLGLSLRGEVNPSNVRVQELSVVIKVLSFWVGLGSVFGTCLDYFWVVYWHMFRSLFRECADMFGKVSGRFLEVKIPTINLYKANNNLLKLMNNQVCGEL